MNDRPVTAPSPLKHEPSDEALTRLSVVQEHLSVSVQQHETGSVRVRKEGQEELINVPVVLRAAHVDVRHVPVNRQVDSEYGPRQEGDTWIVPVFEYIPVTELRLMLKEEIHITRRTIEREDIHTVAIRRDQVIVERREGIDGDWVPET
jgi:stress response protein YsnF